MFSTRNLAKKLFANHLILCLFWSEGHHKVMALCVWNIGVFAPTGNGSQMEGFVSSMTVNDSLMAK
jgi:hypothetical protein